MGQVFGQNRNGGMTVVSNTVVQLNLSTLNDITQQIFGQMYQSLTHLQINTALTGVGGLDTGTLSPFSTYYVHAVLSGSSLALVASLSKTAPTGFSVFQYTGFMFITNGSSQITYTLVENDSVNASYGLAVTQSIPATAFTTILWDTKNFDSHNAYQTSGPNAGNYIIPLSGKYRINATGTPAFTGTGQAQLAVYNNGSLIKILDYVVTTSSTVMTSGSALISCDAGDQVSFSIWIPNSGSFGGNGIQYDYFDIERAGN
jgi:hypothetical protein